jgi:hypothetical protein
LEAFGIAHREHSHSAFLAFLLDPDAKHGFQDRFLRDFVALAADSQPFTQDRENPLPLLAELAIDADKVQVSRERYNIDILINCLPQGPVIGIEIKVWAGEQDQQIKRYQKRLESAYVGRPGLMVFLTPDGRQPSTGAKDHPIPCVCIQWADVADLIDGLLGGGENTAARPFIQEFSSHLKELRMGSREDRALVGSLFKDPDMIRVFRDIEKLRPRFWDQDVMDALVFKGSEVMRLITGSEIDVERAPNRGDAMLTFSVRNWQIRGIPIRFVFYHCPTWGPNALPGMHVLLFEFDSLDEAEKKMYIAIAKQCESLASEPIVARGWDKKHSVLQNPTDGHAVGLVIADESFNSEWIDDAAKIVGDLVRQIHEELESISTPGC